MIILSLLYFSIQKYPPSVWGRIFYLIYTVLCSHFPLCQRIMYKIPLVHSSIINAIQHPTSPHPHTIANTYDNSTPLIQHDIIETIVQYVTSPTALSINWLAWFVPRPSSTTISSRNTGKISARWLGFLSKIIYNGSLKRNTMSANTKFAISTITKFCL